MSELTSRAKDQAASAAQAGRAPGDRPAAGEAASDDAVVRRTKDGWRVGDSDLPDLTSAMVLADLISAELAQPGAAVLGTSADAADSAAETTALTARIRVEQAIGVLAERHRIQPRQAFEQLRTAARNRGRRVIDIASDVVASATNPLLQLPDELSRPRSGARQGRRGRQAPGVLSSE